MKERHGKSESPGRVQGSIWAVTVLLSFYGARDIEDEISRNDNLANVEALKAVTGGLDRVGMAIGMGALRSAVDRMRGVVNEPYTVLREEAEEAPPDPLPAGEAAAPEAEGGLVHRKAKAKRRVLVIGASSIQFAIGVEFERRLPSYRSVKAKRFGLLATGLTRPDFFDWPKKLEELASEFKPDLVITNFGGNDAQEIPDGDRKHSFPSEEWDRVYAARIKEMVDIAKRHGADIVMMGMPIMRKEAFSKKVVRLNRVTKEAVEAAGGLFIPTWKLASTRAGEYRSSLRFAGKRGLMRTSDGVHYTKLGAMFVVDHVLAQIERHFILAPKDQSLARAERHDFESKILGALLGYVAYVPQDLKEERLPALVLLPGKASGWLDWPTSYPHRDLQALATELRRVIVVPELAVDAESPTPAEARALGEELPLDLAAHLPVSEERLVVAHQSLSSVARPLGSGEKASFSELQSPLDRKELRRLSAGTGKAD